MKWVPAVSGAVMQDTGPGLRPQMQAVVFTSCVVSDTCEWDIIPILQGYYRETFKKADELFTWPVY